MPIVNIMLGGFLDKLKEGRMCPTCGACSHEDHGNPDYLTIEGSEKTLGWMATPGPSGAEPDSRGSRLPTAKPNKDTARREAGSTAFGTHPHASRDGQGVRIAGSGLGDSELTLKALFGLMLFEASGPVPSRKDRKEGTGG